MRSRCRYLLLFPAAAMIGLVGCGSSDSDTADEAPTTEMSVETSSTDAEETTSTTTARADEDASNDAAEGSGSADGSADDGGGSTTSALEGFEERDVLERTIPDLDSLRPIVETDNPGTRVILFEDGLGRKVYKSVFVKHDQRLKVLDLDGGPPLFNERI